MNQETKTASPVTPAGMKNTTVHDEAWQKDHPVVLEMKNINKAFPGVKALDGVSLNVRAGSVHALMGENGAGKSTLMKCLFGVYSKDDGTIVFDGREVNFTNSKEALENGVAMVHQELNQALKRTVMDNIWLGRYPTKFGLVSEAKMYKDTQAVFENLEIDVNPKTIMSTMPVAQRQMVEIAKAVSFNSKVIVFDEPTSSSRKKKLNTYSRLSTCCVTAAWRSFTSPIRWTKFCASPMRSLLCVMVSGLQPNLSKIWI